MKNKQIQFRLLAVLLCIVMLLCSILTTNATYQEPQNDDYIESQERAVEANEILMQYFYANGWILEHPNYFGGCYIENNILHIRLISPTSKEMSVLKDILSDYENVVVYEYGNLSLESVNNYADETVAELKNQGIKVTEWYVDATTYNIIIGVIPDYLSSANTIVEEIRARALKNSYPNIIIVEGGYTSASAGNPLTGGMHSC